MLLAALPPIALPVPGSVAAAGLTSSVTVAVADWPCESPTLNDTVDEPVCPATGVSVIVQVSADEPQPELIEMPESGNTVVLLLLALTLNAPDPVRLKEIGAGLFGRVID